MRYNNTCNDIDNTANVYNVI